ncbi:MAG: DUF6152 family protein [Gammaproteobacteria bacterium]
MRFATLVLTFALLPLVAHSHHSFSIYDRSVVHEIEGELVDVRWRNPHVTFTVRAENSDGQVQDWLIEAAAVYVVERSGVQESMFDGVDYVKAAGWRSPSSTTMQVTNLLLPNGTEILLSGRAEKRWSDDAAGGQLAGERVDRADRDLFRVWSIENFGSYGRSVQQSEIRLTEAANARMVADVEFDSCQPQGMPAIMQNPLPIEFIDNGATIDLRLNSFGVLRTIHMDDEPGNEAIPLSDLGYSVGQRMGDTLEVRTTRIGWPYLDDNGTPQTTNVEITELFSLVDNNARLNYSQTVTDPESFLEPVTTTWYWADIGEDQLEYTGCE